MSRRFKTITCVDVKMSIFGVIVIIVIKFNVSKLFLL